MSLEDAPNTTKILLPLEQYENIDIHSRFNKFGWWWECSHDGIIKKVDTCESHEKKASFQFMIDHTKLKENNISEFRLIFAVSTPNLYKNNNIQTSTAIKYKTEDFTF